MSTEAVATAKAASSRVRRVMSLIVVISLLNSMAAMIVIPVVPVLAEGFTHNVGHAALYVGGFAAIFALTQFLASPVLGALSDAHGRRAVILISAFGMAADYLFMALAPSIGWLFVGRMISGVTAASGPAVNAYIADSIPPEERAGAFGWQGASFAAGFLIGPSVGGLLGAINPRLPFMASAGLCLAIALYGLLILPESLPKERRTPFSFRRANPWGSFRFLVDRPQIAGLCAVAIMMAIASQCLPTTLVLYTGLRYGWAVSLVGVYLTCAGVGHLLVQSLVVRRAVKGLGERGAAFTGYAATAVGFLIYATAPVGLLFPIGLPFYAMAGLVGPAVQSQLTRKVLPTEQGRLQGAVSGLTALTGLFAPIMFTQIFAYATGPGKGVVPPGLHLYVGAAVLMIGAALALALMRPKGEGLEPVSG
jgi:DHA1 family tetracycline resistance protein-like MFS transporter